jgi:hypothetical protein
MLPYWFLGSFLMTVFALQWMLQPSYPLWLYGILGILGIFGILRRHSKAMMLTPISLGIAVALLAVSHAADRGRYPDLDPFIGMKNSTVQGLLTGPPDDRGDRVQLTILMENVTTASGVTIPVRGRILVTDKRRASHPLPGDRVRVSGTLMQAEEGSSYARYLAMRDRGAAMDGQSIRVIGNTGEKRFVRLLWHFNRFFHDAIGRVLPEPASGLLDCGFSDDRTQSYRGGIRVKHHGNSQSIERAAFLFTASMAASAVRGGHHRIHALCRSIRIGRAGGNHRHHRVAGAANRAHE